MAERYIEPGLDTSTLVVPGAVARGLEIAPAAAFVWVHAVSFSRSIKKGPKPADCPGIRLARLIAADLT